MSNNIVSLKEVLGKLILARGEPKEVYLDVDSLFALCDADTTEAIVSFVNILLKMKITVHGVSSGSRMVTLEQLTAMKVPVDGHLPSINLLVTDRDHPTIESYIKMAPKKRHLIVAIGGQKFLESFFEHHQNLVNTGKLLATFF